MTLIEYNVVKKMGAELWVFDLDNRRFGIVFNNTRECWEHADDVIDFTADLETESSLEFMPKSVAMRRKNARPTKEDEYKLC